MEFVESHSQVQNDKLNYDLDTMPKWEPSFFTKLICDTSQWLIRTLTNIEFFNNYYLVVTELVDYKNKTIQTKSTGYRFLKWEGFALSYVLERTNGEHPGLYARITFIHKIRKADLLYFNRYNLYWNRQIVKINYGS